MKGVTVENSLVNEVFRFMGLKESQEAPKEEVKEDEVEEDSDESEDSEEVLESEDIHVCPLCESQLEDPLTEERLQEHIDLVLNIINENFTEDGESLDEELEEDVSEESDEDSEEVLESEEVESVDEGMVKKANKAKKGEWESQGEVGYYNKESNKKFNRTKRKMSFTPLDSALKAKAKRQSKGDPERTSSVSHMSTIRHGRKGADSELNTKRAKNESKDPK